MGDVILQTPIVSWVKLLFPKAEIEFITSKEFSSLLEGHPHIDKVTTYKREKGFKDLSQLMSLAKKLRESKPDFIIDLHGSTRSKFLSLLIFKTAVLRIHKRNFLRFLLVRFKLDFLKNLESHHERVINDFKILFQHQYDRNDLISFNRQKSLYENQNITSTAQSFQHHENFDLVEKKYLVLSPVASFESKRWPISYYLELCKLMLEDTRFKSFKFVVIGGPNDTYCAELNSIADERMINLQGKTSIAQSNAYMAGSCLTITNDTGSAHMSESFGVPVLNFFGATSPSFGFKTYLPASKTLTSHYKCSPCSNTGSRKCFQKTYECLEAIKPKTAFENVVKVLEELKYV